MTSVRVCGPVAKVVRQVADVINGPAGPPTAISGPGVLFLITDEPMSAQLMKHEQQHTAQAESFEPTWIPRWWGLRSVRAAIGWARFYEAYGVEYAKHGYWDNKYEREARIVAGEETLPT